MSVAAGGKAAVLWLALVLLAATSGSADEVVLANGQKLKGKVVKQTPEFVTVRLSFEVGGTEVQIPAKNIRSVTIEKESPTPAPNPTPTPAPHRAPSPHAASPHAPPAASAAPTSTSESALPPEPTPVFTPRATAKSMPSAVAPSSSPAAGTAPSGAAARASLSRSEVDALIAKAGSTPPEWWNSVALNYPPTLGLGWPNPPPKQWNAQQNLGQYVWDIINPNPPRWREGVRLLHHVLSLHPNDREQLYRTAEALARMYHNLLQDWARAAFWWRKSAQLGEYSLDDFALELGECYWKLDSKEMAMQALSAIRFDDTRDGLLIKLYSDMGELNHALRLAEAKARTGMPDSAWLAAGDACRLAGRYSEALGYYQRVLAIRFQPNAQGAGWIKRCQERARASIEAIKVFDALDLTKIPDGAYRAVSPGYAGPLEVEVAVKGGRIESVKVVRHQEKQFYSAISDATGQIIAKQGVKGVDMTSGATITAEAIVNATAKALAAAMK